MHFLIIYKLSPTNFVNSIHTSDALNCIQLCVNKYISWWISLGTRLSFNFKTDHRKIAEILLNTLSSKI